MKGFITGSQQDDSQDVQTQRINLHQDPHSFSIGHREHSSIDLVDERSLAQIVGSISQEEWSPASPRSNVIVKEERQMHSQV